MASLIAVVFILLEETPLFSIKIVSMEYNQRLVYHTLSMPYMLMTWQAMRIAADIEYELNWLAHVLLSVLVAKPLFSQNDEKVQKNKFHNFIDIILDIMPNIPGNCYKQEQAQ